MVQSTRPAAEFVYLGMGTRPGLHWQKHKYLQCAVDYSGTLRAGNEAEVGKNAGQRELDRKGRNRKEDCKQMKQSVRIMRKEKCNWTKGNRRSNNRGEKSTMCWIKQYYGI